MGVGSGIMWDSEDDVLDTRPEAKERTLTLEGLRQADALCCCNALRGWCTTTLEEPSLAGSES